MTKEERYKKSVEFLRTFAKKVKTLSKAGLTPLEFWGDVRGLIQTYENQWPNWLDEDIEDVSEEATEEEYSDEDWDKACEGAPGVCSCGAPGTWMFDPYAAEIYERDEPVCLCDDCAHELALEV